MSSIWQRLCLVMLSVLICLIPSAQVFADTPNLDTLCTGPFGDCSVYDTCDVGGSSQAEPVAGDDAQITNAPGTPKNGQSLGGIAGTGFTQEEIDGIKKKGSGSFESGGNFEITTYGPPWSSLQGTGVTSTGVDLRSSEDGRGKPRYAIAVDPSVIPYGSLVKVWPNAVKWRGAFVAADTGGAIVGHHVDVYDWSGRASKDMFSVSNGVVSPYTGSTEVESPEDEEEAKQANACVCAANSDDTSISGPTEGGSLNGVHFPKLADATQLAEAIDDYIKKGWPKSPLIGWGDDFVKYGKKYDVNPTIPVVIAQVEYQFGTLTKFVGKGAPGQYNYWAVTHGNTPGVRFGAYPSIDKAMEEHFALLGGKRSPSYIGPPQNMTTIKQIMNQYAPAFENDTPKYIQTILDGMKKLTENAGAPSEGNDPTSLETGGCQQGSQSETQGIVSADGYAFPIAAKKKSDYKTFGALSALPCKNPGGCHHWETSPRGGYAFDLGVKGYEKGRSEGAPVYAISDGTLVDVKYNRTVNGKAEACNQFQFKSEKDGYVYWYGHLSRDTTIKKGQRFKAGDQIGKVGPTVCADNTEPHLHIDRGYPKGAMGGMQRARDEGIIALINKLFNELPN